jgi:enoyl-CoA hydratase/carnithine racemase
MPRALEIAGVIGEQAPLAVRAIKEAMHRAFDLRFTLREVYDHMDVIRQHIDKESEDGREGPRAFAQKRKPQWTGR